ncbi:MAG: ABC transporter permease [Gammaproteobacteria bacterium]|nr:ABC transporter permease [Gammaproteobacteria bacterium]
MNLSNIGSRKGVASVIVVGIGGVVTVLCAILAMANGFQGALLDAGAPDRVVLLREGSTGEMTSGISTQEFAIVESMDGVVAISGEVYTVADIPKRSTGTPANLIVRGVSPASFDVRPEVQIIEGRQLRQGLNEIIVGVKARAEFANTNLNDEIEIRNAGWRVVGIFEADGSAYESEIWVDNVVAQSAFRRSGYSSGRIRLESIDIIDEFKAKVEDDPRLQLTIIREEDFLSDTAEALNTLIRSFAIVVATIMAIGALFAALNTMYIAVSVRTVEIATLRAIGFGITPVLFSVLLEAVVLAMIGGALGGLVTYVVFNGFTVSTLNPGAFSQIAFDFRVSADILLTGLVWAVVIGMFGGIFPAFRAAELPITVALRGE